MKKSALLIVAMFVFVASTVVAEEQIEDASTNYLYGNCMDFVYQDETLTTSAYCKAFIQGAINAHKHLSTHHQIPKHFCLPKTITEKKIINILIKFIDENPNFIEKPAIATLYYVLDETFPCPGSQSQPAN